MSRFDVRTLSVADYEPLWKLFLTLFPIKFKNEFLDAWLARTPEMSYGAFGSDGQLRGFIVTCPRPTGQMIEFLGVDPTLQKSGIGSRLLKQVISDCERSETRVMLIPVNVPCVIHWYKKHGFTEYGAPHISPYTGELEQTMVLAPTDKIEMKRVTWSTTNDGDTMSGATHSRQEEHPRLQV